MEELILISPTLEYKEDALKFLEEIKQNDADSEWAYAGMSELDKAISYEQWIKDKENESKGINLPDGYVPGSTFFTIRKNDNKIIGMVNIRHELNDFLLKYFGHIGQSIRPSERGKGYGKLQLIKACEKAQELGINNILVTCNELNMASSKTIESCMGEYENSVNKDGVIYKRYWIDTEKLLNRQR